MKERSDLLRETAELAIEYLEGVDASPAFPQLTEAELRQAFSHELPEGPIDAAVVVGELAEAMAPATTATTGGRYFGFVTGGAVPASVAADWLVTAWDQNSFSFVSSPGAWIVEDIAAGWIKELLRLPDEASAAFVTGCQMAHFTCLAAARHHVLRTVGWDVAENGLYGAPRIRIVAGQSRHATVDRALRMLGLGETALELVEVDGQGRMMADALARTLAASSGPAVVVAQAGEVNTGSFDPLDAIVDAAAEHRAWVHVDGAFGIWARVSPRLEHHVRGLERAHSWAFDAHKWLNVPYDSGIAVVSDPTAHRAATGGEAAYLEGSSERAGGYEGTPEASRRARGIAVYAALRSLGRSGLVDLVERCCDHAQQFAVALAEIPGVEILNEVDLNQVLLRIGDDETTESVLAAVQSSGVAWMGGTSWQGQRAIRISVSSWVTTDEDVARTVEAFREAVAGL